MGRSEHYFQGAREQGPPLGGLDTEAAFLDLNLSIHNGIVSTKIYDNWDDFNFDIVDFPYLDGDVPQRPSYVVYIYLNLFALPEHLRMLLTSIIVTNS